MIIYFPDIYPDETFYSLYSRYYANGGCITYTQAATDLFINSQERMDFQFVNRLRPEVIELLTRGESWENVLLQHTMFPYYSRFLDKDRRIMAFDILKKMTSGDYMNLLSLSPNRRGQAEYLRYCPLCTEEHKKRYGETYWMRVHQIPEITVCPMHGCRLKNSNVERDRHKTRYFYPAEFAIEDFEIEYGTGTEIRIAKYIYALMQSDMEIEKDIRIGDYLTSGLMGTQYVSKRGQIINLSLLYQDFMAFYDGFTVGIQKQWQLSKVLHGERINPFEIAQVGMFLGIAVEELVRADLPDKKPEDAFDKRVVEMMNQGFSMHKIAEKLDVSPTLIHLIAKNYGIKSIYCDKFATNINDKFTEKVNQGRIIWRQEMKKYPGLSYTQICEKSEYKLLLRWTRRNDKAWTDKHYPKKMKYSS